MSRSFSAFWTPHWPGDRDGWRFEIWKRSCCNFDRHNNPRTQIYCGPCCVGYRCIDGEWGSSSSMTLASMSLSHRPPTTIHFRGYCSTRTIFGFCMSALCLRVTSSCCWTGTRSFHSIQERPVIGLHDFTNALHIDVPESVVNNTENASLLRSLMNVKPSVPKRVSLLSRSCSSASVSEHCMSTFHIRFRFAFVVLQHRRALSSTRRVLCIRLNRILHRQARLTGRT